MRKAIAAFTIGTLLASFLAVPAAFAAGVERRQEKAWYTPDSLTALTL